MLITSLKYCQANKGLNLHAYVIMSNHVHLIVSVKEGHTISDFVRDLKKFTARSILNYIETDIESRKEWMLHQFKYYASKHTRNEHYQIWTHENHFVELFSPDFTQQKIDYIHNNPVRAGMYTMQGNTCIQAQLIMLKRNRLFMWIVCGYRNIYCSQRLQA